MEDGNLADYCKKKLEEDSDGEEEFALTVSAQLVCALDHIHDQNIIHRDVKPENAKLADFNISRAAEGTVTTNVAGTPDYLPPEAIKNPESEKLCFRRDMWGLGIIFQMLCTFRISSK
ncbi:Oidioi.mRNA.OKI2018_I69.chr2.g8386.t1.cds [Oikopleura dioica]|uniref:non-specific serine/threonine protein kinase n=1 Tax=Oikopleura dioica TaxID=34765 RepID=A0ABN7TDI3_OIKDI|nr:Oidioi.mRNA.OKI2018_I69.chr2.g8386.t1.cds [Oikopleura dioica]